MVSNLAFFVVILCFFTGFALSFLNISIHAQRRIYWSSACIAGVFGVLATYPTWKNAAGMGIFFASGMAVAAYVSTPYIKIGGKIYSLTIEDPDPEDEPPTTDPAQQEIDPHPDSYSGLLTATTMWWALVVLSAIGSGNVYFAATEKGEIWAGVMSGAFAAMLAVVTGHGDASWGYPIARGQYVQFVVNTVITAGVFYFLYVAAYYAGRRHPIRRKHSMEYRVHPRHRELDS
ncbi:hypothetical protein [Mycobacterium sp. UM_Kg1]|uniref:hypothetical protein n=1 Tax=Mycobacterium sp. UM_Kg1 TaxID=1545691 RepID=UPI000ACAE747|nr:hypothetical protein [Mycobacterium sp. UM_Kg1]